jgi:hypothetical protein
VGDTVFGRGFFTVVNMDVVVDVANDDKGVDVAAAVIVASVVVKLEFSLAVQRKLKNK